MIYSQRLAMSVCIIATLGITITQKGFAAMDKTAVICFILDETGSMESIKDDTIGGFNNYIEGLQKERSPIEFSLIKFDSNHIDKVYIGKPIADVPRLTPETYRPGAMTPLIDATYKAITATADLVAKRQDEPRVLIVVQTDGQENASTQYKNTDLALLIKEKTAAGWEFVFLGAGIDAFAQAGAMGIKATHTLDYGRQKSAETFSVLTSNTAAYMQSGVGASLGFSAEQRRLVNDETPRPTSPQTHALPAVPQTVITPALLMPAAPIVDDFTFEEDPVEQK